MTQCNKYQEWMALGAAGGLSKDETAELGRHVGTCSACKETYQGYLGMLEELQGQPLPDPGEAFFERQRLEILGQVHAVEDLSLFEELKSLTETDPGELFFHRQWQAIQGGLGEAARNRMLRWGAWLRPVAGVAAAVLLLLGLAQIRHWWEVTPPGDWAILQEYFPENFQNDSGLFNLEQLNEEQLSQLAANLRNSIYPNLDQNLLDDSGDWEELNEQELNRLINRLEAKAQT